MSLFHRRWHTPEYIVCTSYWLNFYRKTIFVHEAAYGWSLLLLLFLLHISLYWACYKYEWKTLANAYQLNSHQFSVQSNNNVQYHRLNDIHWNITSSAKWKMCYQGAKTNECGKENIIKLKFVTNIDEVRRMRRWNKNYEMWCKQQHQQQKQRNNIAINGIGKWRWLWERQGAHSSD